MVNVTKYKVFPPPIFVHDTKNLLRLLFDGAVYGSDPSFVFSTATSANPCEHCMVRLEIDHKHIC